MTHEVRITVDANLYYKHNGYFDAEEWKRRLTGVIEANSCADHKFIDVKVAVVPHDNDRDYTEQDARRHCVWTYLDAVREALPGCDCERIKRQNCPGWLISGGPVFESDGPCKCKYCGEDDSCGDCWMIECPDDVGEEARDHDD